MSDVIRFDSSDFPVMKLENCGDGNNCLGYALGNFLRCTPFEFRESLKAMIVANRDNKEFLSNVCLSLFEDEEIQSEYQYNRIWFALCNACFIPAEVFILWCMNSQEKQKYLLKCNVIFFVKRDSYYEPVTAYLENVSYSTCYIGWKNFHYEQLIMQKKNSLLFDVAYFAKMFHVSPGT